MALTSNSSSVREKFKAIIEVPSQVWNEKRTNSCQSQGSWVDTTLEMTGCCGSATFRQIVEKSLQEQFIKLGRVSGFRLTELPRPDAGSFVYDSDDYDRMSVAHGLCEMKISLGTIYWDTDGEPVISKAPDVRDRDEDR